MVFGHVYSIRTHQTTDIYIGSTTQPLSKRMVNHRTDYKNYLDGSKKYYTSFEIIKYPDSYIELIYEGEFESKLEMQKREGQEIRNTNCVNKRIAGRTMQEYYKDNKTQILENVKQYYKENREKLLEYQKEYQKDNRETIAEQKNQKFTCVCGGCFTHGNKCRHLKSKKHNLFLQNQKLNIMSV